jgi:ligand-binding sensor domain-containing protein
MTVDSHMPSFFSQILRIIFSSFFFLSGLLLFQANTLSQGQHLNFQRITVEDGLSQGSITTILQDRKGFIWIGTHDGLNRFDGVECKVYRHNPNDSATLSSSWITCLYEDSSGILWVGTNNGLNRFNPSKETFRSFVSQSSTSSNESNRSTVRSIHEINIHDTLMLMVGMDGATLFDPRTETFSKFGELLSKYLQKSVIHSLSKDSGGYLWVASDNSLFRFAPNDTSVIQVHMFEETLVSKNYALLLPDQQDDPVLIGSQQGLYQYYPEHKNFVLIDTMVVKVLLRDRSKNIWIGTDRGIALLSDSTRNPLQISFFQSDPSSITSLSNNFVTAIMEDAAGSIWVGTLNGLNRLDKYSSGFILLRHIPGNSNTIGSNFVLPILEDSKGNIWFGTLGSGISILKQGTTAGHQFTHLQHSTEALNSLSSKIIRSLLEDREGNIWIGGDGRLDLYNPVSARFQRHHLVPPTDTYWTNSMIEARDGSIWAVTNQLIKIIKINSSRTAEIRNTAVRQVFTDLTLGIQLLKYKNTIDSGALLNTVFEDREGIIWIGTDRGLMKFDPHSEMYTGSYNNHRNDPSSLSNNDVWCITEDTADTSDILWVGTSQGLNRFDRRSGRAVAYLEQEGFPNSCVYGILIDEKKRLWLSTNRGITCFDDKLERGKKFKNFDASDGLQGNEFNRQAYYKLRNGHFVFGGTQGVTMFNPMSIQSNPYIPPVILTGFTRMGSRVMFDRAISDVSVINLNYDDAVVTFEFVALNFTKGQKNKYAYMMEGLEQGWIDNGSRRFVSYAGLKPGSYVFRVKASNNDGVWNESGLAIMINVYPPFWETWWFRLVIGMMFIGGLFWIVSIREKRRKEIERLRLRIARDLHDEIGGNLTGIAVAGSLLQKEFSQNDDRQRKAFEITKTAVDTSGLMRDLVWIINPENDTLEDLCFRMKDIGIAMLGNRKVVFQLPNDSPRHPINLEVKRNIFLIYKEILNNIAKHSSAQEVTISMKLTGRSLILHVSDDGVGFGDEPTSRGMGLQSMRARATSVGGVLLIKSEKEKGTQVDVTVPIT